MSANSGVNQSINRLTDELNLHEITKKYEDTCW